MSKHDGEDFRPVPTRLVQFDQVQHQEQGTKIRFLGCVEAYQGEKSTLSLSGTFGIAKTTGRVEVNIEQILPSVNHELLQVGAWLNIIGYVRKPEVTAQIPVVKTGKRVRRYSRLKHLTVEAMMIWSAGAIKLDDYNSAVRSYQKELPSG